MPKPHRPPVVPYNAQAQRGLARRPAAPHCLKEHVVTDEREDDDTQHDRGCGVAVGAGHQLADDEHQNEEEDELQDEVDQLREQPRRPVRQADVERHRLARHHTSRHSALVCPLVDIDVFVAAHQAEWARLETLVQRAERPSRLSGADVDELIALYQRTATHLSVIQSRSPDAHLISRLSVLTARARAAITGTHDPAWRDFSRFFVVTLPAVLYRTARWWVSTALASLAVMTAIGVWVATHPKVIDTIAVTRRRPPACLA